MAEGRSDLSGVMRAWAHRLGRVPAESWGDRTLGGLLGEFYLGLAIELKALQETEQLDEDQHRRLETLDHIFNGQRSDAAGEREWLDEMIAQLERDLGDDEVDICPSKKRSK